MSSLCSQIQIILKSSFLSVLFLVTCLLDYDCITIDILVFQQLRLKKKKKKAFQIQSKF